MYIFLTCCFPIGCLSQVNYHARCYHLTPFSAVTVMYTITKAQVTGNNTQRVRKHF